MIAWLVACAEMDPQEAAAPAARLLAAGTLEVDPLIAGEAHELRVVGAPAGATVRFMVSAAGIGAGPCHPTKPVCTDLLEPLELAGSAIADANGVAATGLSVEVDATGSWWIQAFVGYAGQVAATSVVESAVTPAACEALDEPQCDLRADCFSEYARWHPCGEDSVYQFAACVTVSYDACADVVTPAHPLGHPDACFAFGSACIPEGWIRGGCYGDCPEE
jgi:hypothetical protein